MLPERWRDAKNILAIRLDNIGDIILLGPALRTLRAALPDARITLMASPSGSTVAPLLPWINNVIPFRPVWQDIFNSTDFEFSKDEAFIATLRQAQFDTALIFTSFSQTPHSPAYLCYLAGIPLRVGQSKEFGGSVLTRWVKPLPDYLHQADRNLFLLEQEGFTARGRHLELRVPDDIQARADTLLNDLGISAQMPFIVLAPGASCLARRYPAERYARMLPLLVKATGLPVVVAGSQREQDLETRVCATRDDHIKPLFGKTSVAELAAIIRRSILVIANNSASMHMADAFRKPMAILYTGTDVIEQWRPRFSHARLLNVPVPCAPCYVYDCPRGMQCAAVEPEDIVAEAVELLAYAGFKKHSHGSTITMTGISYGQSSIS